MGFQKGYWTSRWPPSPHTSDRLRWRGRHDQSVSCCPGDGRKRRKIQRGGGERDHQKPASSLPWCLCSYRIHQPCRPHVSLILCESFFAARSISEDELLRRGTGILRGDRCWGKRHRYSPHPTLWFVLQCTREEKDRRKLWKCNVLEQKT